MLQLTWLRPLNIPSIASVQCLLMLWFLTLLVHQQSYAIDFQREIYPSILRDHFVNAASLWETTLHCNIISYWLGTFTKLSLIFKVDFHLFAPQYSDVIWVPYHGFLNHWQLHCLCYNLFELTQREHQGSALLALCEGNPRIISGFLSQRASNVEIVSTSWYKHQGIIWI